MTSNVREDLALEAELADGFAVLARLLGRSRRGELDIVGAKLVESLSNFDFLRCIKVCVGEPGNGLAGGLCAMMTVGLLLPFS